MGISKYFSASVSHFDLIGFVFDLIGFGAISSFAYSPNRSLTVGVLADNKARKRSLEFRASRTTKNVAKTIGFTTLSKQIMLWLQCGGRSVHAAAATATLFSENL